MIPPTKSPAPGVLLIVDIAVLTKEIHRLNFENQNLDWEIPSQHDKIWDNAAMIDRLTFLLHVYEASPPAQKPPVNTVFDQAAKMAVGSIFGTMPLPPTGRAQPPVTNPDPLFQPIRKKHLTLIHSVPPQLESKQS